MVWRIYVEFIFLENRKLYVNLKLIDLSVHNSLNNEWQQMNNKKKIVSKIQQKNIASNPIKMTSRLK